MGFTKAEAEVIKLLFDGLPILEIAKARGVSDETVKRQLTHIYLKAGVRNALGLVAKAYRQGGFLW